MTTCLKFLNLLVPEVNYWFNRTMYNNLLNSSAIQCPTKISDFWRSKDSVVELIFNETADPSGKEYDDGYHFIWKYRTINLSKLHYAEPMLFKRVQVYYNSTWVYAAKDDEKYKDIFNLVPASYVVEDTYNYPYGVKPSKYVNYTSHIVTSGSDQVHYDDPPVESESESEDEPYVIKEAENIFNLTEEELDMLEYLYYYRTGQYELIENWDEDFYYTLESPLSKWVYVYLMCYLYNDVNEDYVKTITDKSDGYFRCLCEKHLQDRVYEYIQKQCMSLWEKINDKGHKDKRSFVTFTLQNKTFLQKNRIQFDNINSGCITIEDIDKNPSVYNNFEFIYDGLKLKNGIDYVIQNIHTESKKILIIKFLNNKELDLTINTKYQFMYSYITYKSPITGIKKLDEQ